MGDISVAGATSVLDYISTRSGQTIGSGECYDLADRALRNAGAKSAPDYGTITRTADYVWGRAITLADVRAGDVVQFRNFVVRVTNADGSWNEETRPHHTAVVASVGANGALTVWEQNVYGSRTARTTTLNFTAGTFGGQTVSTSGTVRFYRPQMP